MTTYITRTPWNQLKYDARQAIEALREERADLASLLAIAIEVYEKNCTTDIRLSDGKRFELE